MKRQRASKLATAFAACLMLAGSCCSGQAANNDSSTPLERSLALWREGDKNTAVNQFAAIDWNSKPVLSPKSPLAAKEKDLAGMTAPAGEKLMGEVMPLLKDLKELAVAVKAKADQTQDAAVRKSCLQAIDKCGAALDIPDGLKIVQLTAKSLRKMAAPKN